MKLQDLLKEEMGSRGQEIMSQFPQLIDDANQIIKSRMNDSRDNYDKMDDDVRYEFGDDFDTLPSQAMSLPIDSFTVEYLMHPQDGSKPFVFDENSDPKELADMAHRLNKDSYDQHLHTQRNPPARNYD